MNRIQSLSMIPAIGAIAFTGCQGTGTSTEIQPKGLYRCIGESGYAPGELEKIIDDLKRQEPVCVEERPIAMEKGMEKATGKAMGKRAEDPAQSNPVSSTDSIRIHTVVLDARCNPVRESVETLADPHLPLRYMMTADLPDASGRSLETGVYYVNVSVESAGGASDTSYAKMGIYHNPCPAR